MTISTLLMILSLAVGAGTSQSFESTSPTDPSNTTRPGKIASNCWINGVWYNPCPSDPPPPPPYDPGPEILVPN